jgi:hypothetical protein
MGGPGMVGACVACAALLATTPAEGAEPGEVAAGLAHRASASLSRGLEADAARLLREPAPPPPGRGVVAERARGRTPGAGRAQPTRPPRPVRSVRATTARPGTPPSAHRNGAVDLVLLLRHFTGR